MTDIDALYVIVVAPANFHHNRTINALLNDFIILTGLLIASFSTSVVSFFNILMARNLRSKDNLGSNWTLPANTQLRMQTSYLTPSISTEADLECSVFVLKHVYSFVSLTYFSIFSSFYFPALFLEFSPLFSFCLDNPFSFFIASLRDITKT